MRLISTSSPVSVPSAVINCVTTVTGLLESTAKFGPSPETAGAMQREN